MAWTKKLFKDFIEVIFFIMDLQLWVMILLKKISLWRESLVFQRFLSFGCCLVFFFLVFGCYLVFSYCDLEEKFLVLSVTQIFWLTQVIHPSQLSLTVSLSSLSMGWYCISNSAWKRLRQIQLGQVIPDSTDTLNHDNKVSWPHYPIDV